METPRTPRPVVGGAAVDSETEESRSFYQDRLRLFAGWVFVISGGFFLVTVLLRLMANQAGESVPVVLANPQRFHVAASSLAGSVWLVCHRVTLSGRRLRRLDAAATIGLAAGYALTGAVFALDPSREVFGVDPRYAMNGGLLASGYLVMARAVALPSAPRRTAWISGGAMLPIVALNSYVLAREGIQGVALAVGSIDIASWGLAGVVIASISSQVSFGLRAEAAKVRQLGQYRLEEKIGEGGMGIVYRARHAMLRRPTAIKVLPPDKVGEASLHRFEREVRLTARLTHPNTVAVFDYSRTPDGLFYYAMEYLDGLNLDQLVRDDGPQTPGRVIHLLRQACGALAEAHGIGLVHGDIKPANLLLVDRGGVPDVIKVVDFGLVKHVDVEGTEATIAVPPGNIVQGTPHYLAPEAVRGDHYREARSDLYALGAVGYFLLTGHPVFKADTVVELFAHHLHTDPTPPSQRTTQTIPAPLEAVILACLKKNPQDRPRNTRKLQGELACCPCQVPWSDEEATAWWTDYRERQQAAEPSSLPAGDQPTLAVDVGDRVAM